jgi:hypothetical protein
MHRSALSPGLPWGLTTTNPIAARLNTKAAIAQLVLDKATMDALHEVWKAAAGLGHKRTKSGKARGAFSSSACF